MVQNCEPLRFHALKATVGIGAQPLGCRNVGYAGGIGTIPMPARLRRFCSLKAALRCPVLVSRCAPDACSAQNLFDDFTRHVREPKIAAAMAEGKFRVVEAQQVEKGG